jgi:serine/threonine-protein phosphatase 2A catalytic subunit
MCCHLCALIFLSVAVVFRCGNKAAIVDIDENMNHKIVQFDHAPPKGVTEVTRTVPEYFL